MLFLQTKNDMEWFTGTVIKGMQNGRKINFPTANLLSDYTKSTETGVYAAEVLLHKKHYYGMLYIGTRPTLNFTQKVIELHLFDFHGDIYNEILQFRVIQKIREEKKFDNMNQLAMQIEEDEKAIRNIINI